MKRIVVVLLLLLGLTTGTRAGAQEQEVQQLLLNVEKLAQLKNILEDLKKGYDIVSQGYTTIKNISEGNFQLHDLFLEGLLQVSPAVKKYKRVGDIISSQVQLVKEYKQATRQIGGSGLLQPGEFNYLQKVYENLLKRSVSNLDALAMVITDRQLRMSDDERLTAIDAIWKDSEESLVFLRRFNSENKVLLLQRSKEKAEQSSLRRIYSNIK